MDSQEKMLCDRIKHHLKQGDNLAAIRDYETYLARNVGATISSETTALLQNAYNLHPRVSDIVVHRTQRTWQRTTAWLSVAALFVAAPVAVLHLRSRSDTQVRLSHCPPRDDANHLLSQSDKAYQVAKYQEAQNLAESALNSFKAEGNATGEGTSLRYIGRCLEAQGLLLQSRQDYNASLELIQKYGAALTAACDEENLAEVDIRLGNFEAAHAELQHAMQCRSDANDVAGIVECLRDQADLQMAVGKLSDSRATLARALSLANEARKPDMSAAVQGQLASIYVKSGDAAAASHYCNLALDHWQKSGHPRWIASAKLKRAEIELLQGQYRLALADYNDTVSAYSSVGDGYSTAAARLIGAQALAGLHSGAAATVLVMKTRQFAERAGTKPLASRCDEIDEIIKLSPH